jgi:hypothetical protein
VPPFRRRIRLQRGSHAGYRRETCFARAECPKEYFYYSVKQLNIEKIQKK